MDICTCGTEDETHLVGCDLFYCATCGGSVFHRFACADDGSETCFICDRPFDQCPGHDDEEDEDEEDIITL